jgi:pSer/pThr/pTyr-binding forkhead associated (FHA) protein
LSAVLKLGFTPAQIRLTGPGNQGRVAHLDEPILSIGRGEENRIQLPKDPKVSRFHAELRFMNSEWWIFNISQKNSLQVNSESIRQKALKDGDLVKLGDTSFVFHSSDLSQTGLTAPVFESSDPNPRIRSSHTQSQSGLAAPSSAGMDKTQVVSSPPSPISSPFPSGATPSSPSFAKSRESPPSSSFQARSQREPPLDWVSNPSSQEGGNRLRFYGILAVVGGIVAYIFMGEEARKSADPVRTSEDIVADLVESEELIKKMQQEIQKRGEDSESFRLAEQHYLKGFRDYQQAQFSRAMQSFQAALSFHPQHELARKYLVLARRKFDEMVRFQMNRGQRYRAKNNHRLCMAAFSQVMIMVKDAQDPVYREAKQFYDECSLKSQGR